MKLHKGVKHRGCWIHFCFRSLQSDLQEIWDCFILFLLSVTPCCPSFLPSPLFLVSSLPELWMLSLLLALNLSKIFRFVSKPESQSPGCQTFLTPPLPSNCFGGKPRCRLLITLLDLGWLEKHPYARMHSQGQQLLKRQAVSELPKLY